MSLPSRQCERGVEKLLTLPRHCAIALKNRSFTWRHSIILTLKEQLFSSLNPHGDTAKQFGCCVGGAMPSRRLTATLAVMNSDSAQCLDGISIAMQYAGHNQWYGELTEHLCSETPIGAGLICRNDGAGYLWQGGIHCDGGLSTGEGFPDLCDPLLVQFPLVAQQNPDCCNPEQQLILIITI